MSELASSSASPITRREFYGALTLIWVYLFILFGDMLRVEWQWTRGVCWFASLFMAVVYLSQAFGSRGTSAIDAAKLPPLSEGVREIARDPSRKIEAIKVYREETGCGLAEAKAAVEAFQRDAGLMN